MLTSKGTKTDPKGHSFSRCHACIARTPRANQSVVQRKEIVFAKITEPNSQVSKLKALDRDYSLLGKLNTRRRTIFLPALQNPNREIKVYPPLPWGGGGGEGRS